MSCALLALLLQIFHANADEGAGIQVPQRQQDVNETAAPIAHPTKRPTTRAPTRFFPKEQQLYEAMLLRHDILRKDAFYGPVAPSTCPKLYVAVTDAKGYGRTGNHFITWAHMLYFAGKAGRTAVVPLYMKPILAHFDTAALRRVGCFVHPTELPNSTTERLRVANSLIAVRKSLDLFNVDSLMDLAKVRWPSCRARAGDVTRAPALPARPHPTCPSTPQERRVKFPATRDLLCEDLQRFAERVFVALWASPRDQYFM